MASASVTGAGQKGAWDMKQQAIEGRYGAQQSLGSPDGRFIRPNVNPTTTIGLKQDASYDINSHMAVGQPNVVNHRRLPSPSPTQSGFTSMSPMAGATGELPNRTVSDASYWRLNTPRSSPSPRLRGKQSHLQPSTEGRHTPEIAPPPTANFSRPRTYTKTSDDPFRPGLKSANTFPRQNQDDHDQYYDLASAGDRGLTTSSSATNNRQTPPFPLRQSTSIPDYHQADSFHTRQRNISTLTSRRPGHDSIASNSRKDIPRSIYDDEVRTSFRSALTATSSYLGTTGTERSSVLTKSSSATSVFGRDEGMSVDDAIGMYENGFQDSDIETPEEHQSRPGTSRSRLSTQVPSSLMEPEKLDTVASIPSLAPPLLPHTIIRDSAQIFSDPYRSLTPDIDAEGALSSYAPTARIGMPLSQPAAQSKLGRPQATKACDDTRDRYGFKKASQHISRAQYDVWSRSYSAHLTRRKTKWTALMKECHLNSDDPVEFPAKSTKIKRFIRKGIPPSWRGAAWFYYAGGPKMLANHPGQYNDLLRRAAAGELKEDANEQIERDLHRTFPDNIRFKPDIVITTDTLRGSLSTVKEVETPILQSLRRVLQAFAIYSPKIGYCQSLNFLAGLLLLFMDTTPAGEPTPLGEEKAFWMLVIITHVYLPGTHSVSLEGANVDLGVLMSAIRESMPQIWAKIGGELDGSSAADYSQKNNRIGNRDISLRLPPITLCCTAWFMSCFIGTLPIETTLRVWDSFFYEGSKTLFRIAMAIFKIGETEIRAVNDPMEIFQTVQTIPRRLIDANALMDACFKRRNGFGHLSQERIESEREERRRAYANERAKAAGVVSVGVKNGSLSRKGTLFRRKTKRAVDVPGSKEV